MNAPPAYDPVPCYPCTGGDTRAGWASLCEHLPPRGHVLAIDGSAFLDWDRVTAEVTAELRRRGAPVRVLDVRDHLAPWEQIAKRTAPAAALAGDPDFATIPDRTLADLFDEVPAPPETDGLALVIGPGAALVVHDELWYADLPKRYAEAAVARGDGRNLGQRPGDGRPTARRLFYVDWPLLDRHREHMPLRSTAGSTPRTPATPHG